MYVFLVVFGHRGNLDPLARVGGHDVGELEVGQLHPVSQAHRLEVTVHRLRGKVSQATKRSCELSEYTVSHLVSRDIL